MRTISSLKSSLILVIFIVGVFLFDGVIKLNIYINYKYAIDELTAFTQENDLIIDNLYYYRITDTNYRALLYRYYDFEEQQNKLLKAYWYGNEEPTIETINVQTVFNSSDLTNQSEGKLVEVPSLFYRDFRFLYLLEFIHFIYFILFALAFGIRYKLSYKQRSIN